MPYDLDSWFREYRFQQRLVACARRERHALRHECNYCGKISEGNLRHCSICKSVRYCDRSCQIGHYRNGHKADCKDFKQLPITAFFMTEGLCDQEYPPHPILGHDNHEDLGMWVSVDGPIDCELRPLVLPMRPPTGPYEIQERQQKSLEDPSTTTEYKAHANHLLTVQILVQNRSQAKEPVMVFASRTIVECNKPHMEKVMGGYLGIVDHCLLDKSTRVARCGPAHDPFTKRPRLFIKNFNGHEIRDDAFMPSAVISAEEGIFLLRPGDFAILQMQFRLGDGNQFRKEFEALSFMDSLFLPIAAGIDPFWAENPHAMKYIAQDINHGLSTRFRKSGRLPSQGLWAAIDQDAVSAYYVDFLGYGRQDDGLAFAISHYGREQAERWDRIRRNVGSQRLP